MDLDDFRKADCRLFRVPPIDLSHTEEDIEKKIVDIWRAQGNAQTAFDSILNDQKLVKTLTGQIYESMDFQKKVGLQNIKHQESEVVYKYRQEQREKLSSIESTIGTQVKTLGQTVKEHEKTVAKKAQAYDAAQASLEETRQRIKERISILGGKNSVESLFDINEVILQDEAKPVSSVNPANVQAKNTYPTNNSQAQNSAGAYVPKKERFGKRAIKKIWAVLNYKIW